jgi:hypothetical protein
MQLARHVERMGARNDYKYIFNAGYPIVFYTYEVVLNDNQQNYLLCFIRPVKRVRISANTWSYSGH